MGTAFVFGDDVDTDQILPGKYLAVTDEAELATHCMEGVDPTFPERFEAGDVVVAGTNFGGGSSREHAPIAIGANGAAAVVASSFARIFYRNAINIGLPVVELDRATERIDDGDEVVVDTAAGTVENRTTGETYDVATHPPFIQEIIDAGGLIEYGRTVLDEE
ncbi:3-isopropylmalate dehydratase [Halorarius halobius]|uniref:LeuD/DmdB family oxidoreductase small subunit n=1 Tax=Halorarius halobius TaxID=2962671 RepID=UPI0020CC61DD|nr:3-isopropylmalate dehydratase [Halorarius halobius]